MRYAYPPIHNLLDRQIFCRHTGDEIEMNDEIGGFYLNRIKNIDDKT